MRQTLAWRKKLKQQSDLCSEHILRAYCGDSKSNCWVVEYSCQSQRGCQNHRFLMKCVKHPHKRVIRRQKVHIEQKKHPHLPQSIRKKVSHSRAIFVVIININIKRAVSFSLSKSRTIEAIDGWYQSIQDPRSWPAQKNVWEVHAQYRPRLGLRADAQRLRPTHTIQTHDNGQHSQIIISYTGNVPQLLRKPGFYMVCKGGSREFEELERMERMRRVDMNDKWRRSEVRRTEKVNEYSGRCSPTGHAENWNFARNF